MKKGITPVIAIIVLLLITIALAGAAFTFLQGYMETMIANPMHIPPGGAFCVRNTSGAYLLSVTVTNIGNVDINGTEIAVARVDNAPVSGSALFSGTIIPGNSTLLINNWDCLDGVNGCSRGTHTVVIGTLSDTKKLNVVCS